MTMSAIPGSIGARGHDGAALDERALRHIEDEPYYVPMGDEVRIFQTCHELHTLVMRAIALGLDLEETFFDDKINEQYHNMRLLNYPPIRRNLLEKEGQARAGAHSGTPFYPRHLQGGN